MSRPPRGSGSAGARVTATTAAVMADALGAVNDKQRAFIEYLADPRSAAEKGTQGDWARANGTDPTTCSRWKKDGDFRRAWEQRLMELNQDPDRVQKVVDALWERARAGDVKAADLYLRYVDRFTPKTALVDERRAQDMSDEELAAQLEDAAAGLRVVK